MKVTIKSRLSFLQRRLDALDQERRRVILLIENLKLIQKQSDLNAQSERSSLTPQEKIALFRSIFIARNDVYARRFEGRGAYKSGYAPVCINEWKSGICQKKVFKCSQCRYRQFESVSDQIIEMHLKGHDMKGNPFTIGTYPLMLDNTCRFLVADFDGENFQIDAQKFVQTCENERIPVYIERSRSGNGAHIWFFFAKAISATLARRFVSILLTKKKRIIRN